MSRLAFKSVVYHGDLCLGELDAVPADGYSFQFANNEIRIHRISSISKRCPPVSILQTVSPFSVLCKLESSSAVKQANLINLHASCFYEFKTAVVLHGEEEIHLVAMPSRQKKFACFWCFSVPLGLYESSLALLNPRCLAIVFDLDETLIVANTIKSFEDRIEALRGRIARETEWLRMSEMSAELKRYIDDRALLKQYADSDCVMDNGKMYKVQLEEVPQLSDSQEKVVRPVIRLQEKNIVLTRINPEIRNTSVLVRLRPGWDDLRSYLTAKGRKRFEVHVCTRAERDYALEMWRLLDPEGHLINSKQLLNRVVCVKSGSRKSLANVFQDGNYHPKMAMVIDGLSRIWEDRDQPRVHVVAPFAPYYAPQVETANAVPVLRVARNVACKVRGYFFKEFDENLLRKISEVFYEDEVVTLPHAPDVSNYLLSEDSGFVRNGSANTPFANGRHGAETDKRFNPLGEKHAVDVAGTPVKETPHVKSETSQPTITIIPNTVGPTASRMLMPSQKPGLLGNPARQDFDFSDRDHDMKRRIFTMKHDPELKNQSLGEPPLLSRPPVQLPAVNIQPPGGLPVEEDSNKGHINLRQVLGRSNIQIIPTPVTELSQWWSRLNVSSHDFIRSKIGKLVSVIHVAVHINLIQAVSHFWNPITSTFSFNKHELVPTIEEYNVAIGVAPVTKLIRPPVGLEPAVVLAQFLETNADDIEKVLKAHNNGCPLTFLVKRYAYPTEQCMRQSSRAFLLAFFGFVVFPQTKHAMNPLVAHLVEQVCCGMNFTNMILAETFLSLTRFKHNQKGSFHAPAALLQIWFLSHTKEFGCNMGTYELSNQINPIKKFLQHAQLVPKKSFTKWLEFLKNVSPGELLWCIKWTRFRVAHLAYLSDGPVPLVGFTGCTSYYPLRVVRQFGALQEIPPPLKPDLFRLNLIQTNLDKSRSDFYQRKVGDVERAWHDCQRQEITWATDLEGEMKEHHASLEYINRVVDPECLPSIPDRPVWPTHDALQQQIEQLKRERDEARANASNLALQNKRLCQMFELP